MAPGGRHGVSPVLTPAALDLLPKLGRGWGTRGRQALYHVSLAHGALSLSPHVHLSRVSARPGQGDCWCWGDRLRKQALRWAAGGAALLLWSCPEFRTSQPFCSMKIVAVPPV